MRGKAVVVTALVAAALAGRATSVCAQTLVEVRGADTKYRYADASYTWGNGVVADVFYVGVPGSNEVNAGGGIALKRGALVATPLAYAVFGREDGQRGLKLALLIAYDKGGWKLLSFLGRYVPVSGAVPGYTVLDTLDVTRAVGRRWEAGLQAGFFQVDEAWNPQVGPVVKLNDAHGAWAVSYRFGPSNELRACRVLTF
jgi:hypothetical protein